MSLAPNKLLKTENDIICKLFEELVFESFYDGLFRYGVFSNNGYVGYALISPTNKQVVNKTISVGSFSQHRFKVFKIFINDVLVINIDPKIKRCRVCGDFGDDKFHVSRKRRICKSCYNAKKRAKELGFSDNYIVRIIQKSNPKIMKCDITKEMIEIKTINLLIKRELNK